MEKSSPDQTTAEVVAEVVHRAKAELDVVITAVAKAVAAEVAKTAKAAVLGLSLIHI